MPSKEYTEIMANLEIIEFQSKRKNTRDSQIIGLAGEQISEMHKINQKAYAQGYQRGARDTYTKFFPQDGGGTSKKEGFTRILVPPN